MGTHPRQRQRGRLPIRDLWKQNILYNDCYKDALVVLDKERRPEARIVIGCGSLMDWRLLA
jgi:hypothetical protein